MHHCNHRSCNNSNNHSQCTHVPKTTLIADHYLCPNISTKPMITPSHMCGVTQSGFQTYRRRHRVVVWPLIFIRLFRVKKSPISLSFKFWTVRLRPPLTNIYYCFGHQLPNYEPITEPRLPAHNPYWWWWSCVSKLFRRKNKHKQCQRKKNPKH